MFWWHPSRVRWFKAGFGVRRVVTMHRDTVIGIVGVVILVAAMIGVFTYERGQAANLPGTGGGAGNATFSATAPAISAVAVGGSGVANVTLNQTGMTNVTFTITWTPGQNSIDTVSVSIAPGATTQMTTGASSDPENDGSIEVTVPIPNTASDGTIGVGPWEITVTFESAALNTPAGQPPVQPPPPVPVQPDSTLDFTVAIAGTAVPSS